MSGTVTEERDLKMHPKLLLDVIKRQAGSLHKAILEGCMNGIEARCSRLDIEFDPDKNNGFLTLSDDGEGIGSAEDIERFFETFGTPHDDSENKTWAQFRMGRGQLFAFGRNVWRTATFRMVVDIKENGLKYNLTQNLPQVKGCKIEISLYKNPIKGYDYPSVDSFRDQIKKQVRFMPIPIHFNGEQVNTPAEECDWTSEDNDAYYLWGAGTDLTVYNLGAYCKSLSASHAGNVGIIVSKLQLKVNFARNDIQSDCEVWCRIKEVIQANRIKKRRKTSRRMTDYEKESCFQDMRDGIQSWEEVKNISMIPTANDRFVTLEHIRKNRQLWSFSQLGCRKADKIITSDRGLVFDEQLYLCLNYTGPPRSFFSWLLGKEFKQMEVLYRDFDSISEGIGELSIILPHSKLNTVERRILKWLSQHQYRWNGRTICIGQSDTAVAWTDGSSFIALDRDWLKRTARNYRAAELIATMLHETCHDVDSSMSHCHGEEFYRAFHDIAIASNSPIQIAVSFYQAMRQMRIIEKYGIAKAKEEKAAMKVNRKLGLNDSGKIAARARRNTTLNKIGEQSGETQSRKTPHKKGRRVGRRRPMGAM